MPYLNVDPDFFNHPKVKRLRRLLGPEADVYPIRLWAHCARFYPVDGLLKGCDAGEIEAVVDFAGKPGTLIEALVKVGLLEKIETGFRVHDWPDHEGHINALRERARNAAIARWRKIRKTTEKMLPQASTENTAGMLDQSSVPPMPSTHTSRTIKKGGRPFLGIVNAIAGRESLIANGQDPSPLVDKLQETTGWEECRIWAAIIQARQKENPPGFLTKILTDAEFQIADSAWEQAKAEMKRWGR